MVEHAERRITEEMLEELRRRKGVKLRYNFPHLELASKDMIRNFAYGLGDANPLWMDEEYAKKTRYGCIVAPPYWPVSVAVMVPHGLPGLPSFHRSDNWEFYKPVLVGDTLKAENIFTGFEEKQSKSLGRIILMYQDRNYYNQRDELVAKCTGCTMNTEGGGIQKGGRHSGVQLPHPWQEEELKKIEDEILAEQVRGARVRYWEDVEVGDELPQLVRGPLSDADIFAFFAGHGGGIAIVSHGIALATYRRHPTWGFRDPETHAMEPAVAFHWNKHIAKAMDLPYPCDMGIQRHCFLIVLLTHWQGDEGWLKRCRAEFHGFFFLSDVIRIGGRVTKKYIDEDGDHCVDIDSYAMNQRGEEIMPGKSTIALPSREKGIWPVEKKLPGQKKTGKEVS
jgi:acyl dehydratase